MKNSLILFLAISASLSSAGQNAMDKQDVEKVVIAFQDDFNDGGFKKAIAYTTNDWEHLNPGGGITKGREEVLKEVRAVHQTFLKGVTITIETITVRFITSDVAIADVIHKISTYEMPEGVKHENERHLKSYVVVRQKGKWLLTHDQNTIISGH